MCHATMPHPFEQGKTMSRLLTALIGQGKIQLPPSSPAAGLQPDAASEAQGGMRPKTASLNHQ